MIGYAEALFLESDRVVPNGERHFADLWPVAMRIVTRGW